jgi:hypothetical protein
MEKVVDIKNTSGLKYKDAFYGRYSRGYQLPSFLLMAKTGIATSITAKLLTSPLGRFNKETRIAFKNEAKLGQYEENQGNVFFPENAIEDMCQRLDGTARGVWESPVSREPDALAQNLMKIPYVRDAWNAAGPGLEKSQSSRVGKVLELARPLLTTADGREKLKKEWVRMFFEAVEEHSIDNSDKPQSGHSIIDLSWVPRLGFILPPKVPVTPSYHADFPTQAIINIPRVPPRDFAGIFVNTFRPLRGPYKGRSSFEKLQEKPGIHKEALKYVFFERPELVRPFGLFLEGNGFSHDEVVSLVEHREEIESRLDTEGAREDFGDGEIRRLEELAREFISKELREGEPLWAAVERTAERLKIPIYALDGSILWPQQMSYEEVKELVAERAERSRLQGSGVGGPKEDGEPEPEV